MKERPILFSGPMVRALLAGTKTQTRRALRDQSAMDETYVRPIVSAAEDAVYNYSGEELLARCPYGMPGNRLWVRETHLLDPPIDGTWPSAGDTYAHIDDIPAHYRSPKHVIYRADRSDEWAADWRWRPAIFMPRWASRLTLEITSVSVERLQEITLAGAEAEGCQAFRPDEDGPRWWSMDLSAGPALHGRTAVGAFAKGWDSINAKRGYGWTVNPWVWVLGLRPVEGA